MELLEVIEVLVKSWGKLAGTLDNEVCRFIEGVGVRRILEGEETG